MSSDDPHIYSEVAAPAGIQEFTMDENVSYELRSGKHTSKSTNTRCSCTKLTLLVLSVTMAALLLAAAAACVAFYLDISKLKSDTAALKMESSQQPLQNALASRVDNIENLMQQLHSTIQQIGTDLCIHSNGTHSTTDEKIQLLNSTIHTVLSQGYSSLDDRFKQLNRFWQYHSAVKSIGMVYSFLESGLHANVPVASCAALPPSSPSGYYWVRVSNGSSVRVYCDTTRSCGGVTGGWRRVAYLDMANSSQQCPSGLREQTDSNIRTCRIISTSASCSSVTLSSAAVQYSRVCGRIIAYQKGSTDGFERIPQFVGQTLEQIYLDGISLTHGSPRQHIWSFASAIDETGRAQCPCINVASSAIICPPADIGDDYFCDTASHDRFNIGTFYANDPLWDGAGCAEHLNTCCSFNNPPWFYKQLPILTTDDIEMRVCRDEAPSNEDIGLTILEIYTQ